MITTIKELEAIYGEPHVASLKKDVGYITPMYQKLIEASPFVAFASIGPEGMDCTPRGDKPGFVRVVDKQTLMMPDRRGNNRIDTLRNIVRDPRVALLFVIPGSNTTFRVNGKAHITVEDDVLASFEVDGKLPRSVIVVKVEAAYFQCGRAVIRAGLWSDDARSLGQDLPSAGEMIDETVGGGEGGKDYDSGWEARAKKSMW